MKKILVIIITAVLAGGEILFYWPKNQEEIYSVQANKEKVVEEEIKILNSLNLEIPFQPQAPEGNWELPWQEACEEASLILAVNYLRGEKTLSPEEMKEKVLTLVAWQEQNWGGHHDLTLKQLATLAEYFYGTEAEMEIIENFSWEDVKKALNQNYPVLAPAAGRELGNPNFTAPGPLYHMLVIRGYTPDKILTNDVGTRRGENYAYNYDTLYQAIHDWNPQDIAQGEKNILIVKPK